MPYYEDVSGVTLGSTSITTVQSVSFTESSPSTTMGGDGNSYPTARVRGMRQVSGTIALADVAQAQALVGDAGTLGFTGEDSASSDDATVSIVGVEITDCSTGLSHAGAGTASLSFNAISADGTTSPVTIT